MTDFEKLIQGYIDKNNNDLVFDTIMLKRAWDDFEGETALDLIHFLINYKYKHERELKCTCKEYSKQRAICPVCDKEKYQQNLKDNNERTNRL